MSELRKIEYLEETKDLIKQAIIDKGGSVADTDTFRSYADKISELKIASGENKLAEFLSNKNITINAIDFGDATSIRNYLFYASNIIAVEIPNTITSIGTSAFDTCSSLTSIFIPNSIQTMGTLVFSSCSNLAEVIFEENSQLTSIQSFSFQNCNSLVTIIIPSSVTSIGSSAFRNCQELESVAIEEGAKSIGNSAFQGCQKLVNLVIPTTITEMGNTAFQSCTNLKNLTIPSGVKTLNSNVFGNCSSLEKVSFLENSQLTTISSGAFYLCSKVSLYDFRNCTKVPSLANVNALQHSVGCQIVVPDALYDEWTIASVWSTLTDIVWVKASEYVEG